MSRMQCSSNSNIANPIFLKCPIQDIYRTVPYCCAFYSPLICCVNEKSTPVYPPPTLQILSNNFRNSVSRVIAVLAVSRPRTLRLARRVSSRAVFGASGLARFLSCCLIRMLFLRRVNIPVQRVRYFLYFAQPNLRVY